MGETEPSLMVNWYEVEIFDTAKNRELIGYVLHNK